jgi:hypothetical protein
VVCRLNNIGGNVVAISETGAPIASRMRQNIGAVEPVDRDDQKT